MKDQGGSTERSSWDQLMGAGETAFEHGHYDKAEELFLLSLHEAETISSVEIRLAENLRKLANAYAERNMYTKAETICTLALNAARAAIKSEPDLNSWITDYFDDLGHIFLSQKKYEHAEKMFERSYTIDKELSDSKDPHDAHVGWVNVASDLHNIAQVFYRQGKYAEAEELLRRALEIDLEHHEPSVALAELSDLSLPTSLVIAIKDLYPLAKVCAMQRKYREAEELYQRSLTIYEEHSLHNDIGVADLLDAYADLLHQTERPDEAATISARAKSIRERLEQ